jgi:BirA family biotin operon repressor/biotin-[acetyl-CoA-carboxylase] ligase
MTKDDLLLLFKKNQGRLLSGGAAAKELSVSRNAVWKAVCSLKEEGFLIDTVPNKGYQYCGHNDEVLSATELRFYLQTETVGCKIFTYSTLASTNIEARKLAEAGAPDGTVVLADHQSAGKGRREHAFYSPAGAGIYMSVLLRPSASVSAMNPFLIRISLAVADAIESMCGLNVQIKWPNDIFWNGKKLCGILTNCSISAEDSLLEYVVAGIGVNVKENSFPDEIPAVSLEEALQSPVNRHALAALILEKMEAFYRAGEVGTLSSEQIMHYERRMEFLGKQAKINYMDGRSVDCRILGIGAEGFLRAQTKQDTIVIRSGEASIQTC